MNSSHPPAPAVTRRPVTFLALCLTLAVVGCATPGLPRPPFLNLPEPVRDLTATRIGDTVELHFTVPTRSTDKLPLRGTAFAALFCRQLDHQPCVPLALPKTAIPTTALTRRNNLFTWTDILPDDLTHGTPHTLGYRVEILNPTGQSAGNSTPCFTATGEAPSPVQGFHAEGSRLGIVLRWNATSPDLGMVTLLRTEPATKVPAQRLTPPADSSSASLLDTTAKPGLVYRYIATRSLTVQLGGRAIELRSAPSPTVELALQQTYPPLAPTGLTAAAFFSATQPTSFAVDLIWQPINEPNVIVPLAGYNLYREPTDSSGHASASSTRLNSTPIALPSFHDTTADPSTRYRYTVTAVDANGNESGPASTLVAPSQLQ